MLVYRLGIRRHPENDGLGASLYGGRWNHKGTPVIYSAASRALCALEILANADELAGDYAVVPIQLPDDLAVTNRSVETLPLNWNAREPGNDTRDIGTNWANSLETTVLVVCGNKPQAAVCGFGFGAPPPPCFEKKRKSHSKEAAIPPR